MSLTHSETFETFRRCIKPTFSQSTAQLQVLKQTTLWLGKGDFMYSAMRYNITKQGKSGLSSDHPNLTVKRLFDMHTLYKWQQGGLLSAGVDCTD